VKKFSEMDGPQLRAETRAIAEKVSAIMPPGEFKDGRCGFILLMFETQEPTTLARYASNIVRENAIASLKEFIHGLENREEIPS
jgi:hypothetical protein